MTGETAEKISPGKSKPEITVYLYTDSFFPPKAHFPALHKTLFGQLVILVHKLYVVVAESDMHFKKIFEKMSHKSTNTFCTK